MRLYYEIVKPTEKDRKPFAKGLKYKSVGRIQGREEEIWHSYGEAVSQKKQTS